MSIKAILGGMIIAALFAYASHWAIGLLIAFAVLYKAFGVPGVNDKPVRSDKPRQDAALPTSGTACYETKQEAKVVPCDIESNGGFDFEIVGESHYQDVIAWSVPLSYRLSDKFRLYTIATIYQDDDNEHDKNAVAVQLYGETVGYVARADAKRFRKWAAKEGVADRATCRAVIVRNNSGYGIWLDLPIANTDY